MQKFTQEIKDIWLKALKSGDYIQTQYALCRTPDDPYNKSGKTEYCCIGVLGKVCDFLNNKSKVRCKDPYSFLISNIGTKKLNALYTLNDETMLIKHDYSNVIPFIEELKTN